MPCVGKVKKFAGKVVAILILPAILLGVFAYYMKIVYPLVREIAESETAQITTQLINNALEKIKPSLLAYGSFYSYEKNAGGEIVFVSADGVAMNQAYIMIKTAVFNSIKTLENYTLNIPVGAFTGLSVFAEDGSDIPIKVMPIGNSDVEWVSEFQEKGINQTLHRILIEVDTEVVIHIPVKTESIHVKNAFVISENLVVGRVPESYITGATEDDTFDLLP